MGLAGLRTYTLADPIFRLQRKSSGHWSRGCRVAVAPSSCRAACSRARPGPTPPCPHASMLRLLCRPRPDTFPSAPGECGSAAGGAMPEGQRKRGYRTPCSGAGAAAVLGAQRARQAAPGSWPRPDACTDGFDESAGRLRPIMLPAAAIWTRPWSRRGPCWQAPQASLTP